MGNNISSVIDEITDAFVNYDNTNPPVVEIELDVINSYNLHIHHEVAD